MFLTPINVPVWVAFLAAIFYGLMGALIGVSVYRKKHLADMDSLGKAYDDLDAQYDKLLSFYGFSSNINTPIWLYVPKVFDLEDQDRPIMMVDASFALRFCHVEDIEKLIKLIEESYKLDEEVTMRDILDFCYCPSCSDDAFFGWKASDILEQYRCIQENDDDPYSYWRLKLPDPHVIDPDLLPYPIDIVFYDPEDFLKRYEAEHKETK